MYKTFEMELAGRPLKVDVGRVAKQANGAVLMHYGDTTVLCTATASEKPRDGIDFFPLSVEYNERMYRGFATACPSQQKQRSLRRQHGLPLHWSQLPKPGRTIAPPGSCKSRLKILCHSMSHPRLMGLFYYIFRRA